jgi:hypothetical protein
MGILSKRNKHSCGPWASARVCSQQAKNAFHVCVLGINQRSKK